jgi:hypothetical protein
MACPLPVQAGALPGLSATDARGVAAAGDMEERAVSHFRSETAPRLELKGQMDQCVRNHRLDWRKIGSGNRLKGNFARKTL